MDTLVNIIFFQDEEVTARHRVMDDEALVKGRGEEGLRIKGRLQKAQNV